jgi:F-type H+-transporting ATPase subunit a
MDGAARTVRKSSTGMIGTMLNAGLKKAGVAVVALVLLASPMLALASGGGGDHKVPSEDHWSVFSTMLGDNLMNNVRYMWGGTAMGQEAPSRVQHVFMGLVVFFFALFVAKIAAQKFKKPGDESILPEKSMGWFTFFELMGNWFYDQMVQTMGKKQAKYFFPLIMSLAIFILFSNLLGMIPGFLPVTDNLNTTLALGSVVFFATHVYGVKEHGAANYFAHFLGPMRGPKWIGLMVLMLLIELISHFVRPLSLGMRLMGNMFGDHAVLGVFLSFGILLLPLPVMALGLLVSCVQTLVFCLLSIVYIALAVEHAEGH